MQQKSVMGYFSNFLGCKSIAVEHETLLLTLFDGLVFMMFGSSKFEIHPWMHGGAEFMPFRLSVYCGNGKKSHADKNISSHLATSTARCASLKNGG